MSIFNDLSKIVYRLGPALRSARAVERSIETGSPKPIFDRIGRVYATRAAGQLIRALFPPHRG
jgi:hypothetical protein